MNSRRPGLLPAALATLLLAAGCQVQPERPDAEPEATEPPAEAREPATVERAVDLLQDGRAEAASEMLREILADREDPVAAGLLEQVETDPEELLGSDYLEIRVAPGESLSLLASRHLGDAMKFYALARYNDIRVPRLLEAGRVLRIPSAGGHTDAAPEAPEPAADAAAREQAARRMVAGRPDEAVDMLMAAPGALSTAAEHLLADAAVELARNRTARDRRAAAVTVLEAVLERLSVADARERVEGRLDALRAREAFDRGRALEQAGAPEEAQAAYARALELDPDLAAAREAARLLRRSRVETLHQQALTAWRDRRVGPAIERWEQVLEIDPEFEPARVYLERARRLRERLEEL